MGHVEPLQEHADGVGLHHLGHDGLQPEWKVRLIDNFNVFTGALATQSTNPYFAADISPALKASANQIWQGWSLTTYPDQPTWSNKVVTALVAGKSLSSQLQPFGDSLTQVAKAAGYSVTNK